MDICISDIKEASLGYLRKLQSIEGDLEIARRVVENDKQTVNFFLDEFSRPFLDYIGGEIMKRDGVYVRDIFCYYPTVYAEYFEFIGAGFLENIPEWHKVSLYKGIKNNGGKDARLYTYINTITVRYFIAIKKKEDKKKEIVGDNLLETVDVNILKEYDGFDEIVFEEEMHRENVELKWAWGQLKKHEQLILQYLVIEGLKPLDVFDTMISYINTNLNPQLYSKKQKQDAMSLMKQRAKVHLRKLIIEFRKKSEL